MKIQLAVATAKVYYHGTREKFTKFSEYRPAFFTEVLAYAEGYGHNIMKARLDIRHIFDTRHDKRAVEIYNEYFLPSGLARQGARKLKLGEPVSMHHADELWSYLSVPEYPAPHYDGILVFEQITGDDHEALKGAEFAYVPMHISQIHLVK